MNTQSFPDPPGSNCTCMRVWLAVIPPPPCPVHGQAYMLKASNIINGQVTIASAQEYVISATTIQTGAITSSKIINGTLNINRLDGQ